MKKKTLSLLLALILALALAACGTTAAPAAEPAEESAAEEAVEEAAETEEPAEEAPAEEPAGSVVSIDGTTVTITGSDEGTTTKDQYLDKVPVFTGDDIGYTVETGPMIFTVNWIQVSTVTVHDKNLCDMLGIEKDQEIAAVTINATAENTIDDEVDFYPDQGTIVTNTKEQVSADLWLSDEVGGFFYGQVVKEGVIAFFLPRSAAEDITHIQFRCEAPNDASFAPVGDVVTIDFELIK